MTPSVGRAGWLVAVSVMLATFMEVLDTTVVNVSLPHISGTLGATIEESVWVLTSYLVANAIVLPLTGWLSIRFGRKRLLATSVAGFTAASFMCGLSPTLGTLVFFRIVQGATGGALQPLSQSVMLDAFPPSQRGRAMGIWGMGVVVAPILGPVLGGWLTDDYSWRWVFYINVPVGILSFLMIERFVHDPPYMSTMRVSRIDYWGIGMLAVGIGALQLVLDLGREREWFASTMITVATVVAAVLLTAFIVHALRTEHPVVDLRVFKIRTYAAGVTLMTALGFALYASLVLLPLMLQTLMGFSSLQAGLAMAPRGAAALVGMPFIGALIDRIDPRKIILGGMIITAATLFWFSQFNLQAGYWDVFWPQFLQGFGISMIFVPLTTTSMAPIPKERMGYAASLFNLMRNVGGSVGIAVSGTLLTNHQQAYTQLLGTHITAYQPGVQQMLARTKQMLIAGGADPVTAASRAQAILFGTVQRHAAMASFIQMYQLLAIVFALLVPLLLLMKRPQRGGGGHVGAH